LSIDNSMHADKVFVTGVRLTDFTTLVVRSVRPLVTCRWFKVILSEGVSADRTDGRRIDAARVRVGIGSKFKLTGRRGPLGGRSNAGNKLRGAAGLVRIGHRSVRCVAVRDLTPNIDSYCFQR
jgi:hypothetical protein